MALQLEQLLLTKEELPLRLAKEPHDLTGFRHPFLVVPIHPKLFLPGLSINPSLAHDVFEQAAKEWYEDLKLYLDSPESEPERKWTYEVFVKPGLRFRKERGEQVVAISWSDFVRLSETGFAYVLSISRDGGGTLGIAYDEPEPGFIGKRDVLFTPEKFAAYAAPGEESTERHTLGYQYGHHNIDHYPGALFLRNWAILYLNAALKDLDEKGLLLTE